MRTFFSLACVALLSTQVQAGSVGPTGPTAPHSSTPAGVSNPGGPASGGPASSGQYSSDSYTKVKDERCKTMYGKISSDDQKTSQLQQTLSNTQSDLKAQQAKLDKDKNDFVKAVEARDKANANLQNAQSKLMAAWTQAGCPDCKNVQLTQKQSKQVAAGTAAGVGADTAAGEVAGAALTGWTGPGAVVGMAVGAGIGAVCGLVSGAIAYEGVKYSDQKQCQKACADEKGAIAQAIALLQKAFNDADAKVKSLDAEIHALPVNISADQKSINDLKNQLASVAQERASTMSNAKASGCPWAK